ncbi:hypothetical protein MesoLj131c_36190 [Mesorhizobium sp. 131-3-5]|nr:hypothetical protein MesoLj131c_36190 [Mesorhizobium sp. 131-3-5]
MRKSQPCYANAQTNLMVTLPAADYSHAFGHDMALALLPLGLGTPGTALEVSILGGRCLARVIADSPGGSRGLM